MNEFDNRTKMDETDQSKQIVESTKFQTNGQNSEDHIDSNKLNKNKRKKKNKKANGLNLKQLNKDDKLNNQIDQSDDNQSEPINRSDQKNQINQEIQTESDNQKVQDKIDQDNKNKMSVNVNIDDKSIENVNIQIDTSTNVENNSNDLIEVQITEVINEKLKDESNQEVAQQNDLQSKPKDKKQNKHQMNGKQNGKLDDNKSNETDRKIPELLSTENNRPNKFSIISKLMIGAILIFKFFTFFVIKFIGLFHPSRRFKLPPINEPLLLLRASEITEKIKNGELKCEKLIRAYINRIEKVQPKLNAVIDNCFEEAINKAKEIDEQLKVPELAAKLKKLPLLGVPFTCKDSISIKGLLWTSGVKIRKGIKADEDSTVIKNLRAAGAIPLALTNTPELVLWWDTENKLYGRTNNPYDLSRIVGGSSGGEGCLISAAGSLFGVGSDVGGSIRIPAMFNGVFGHKTIKKYVPVDRMFPSPPPSFDGFVCFGPIARYASDLPIFLRAMGGSLTDELRLDEPVDLKKIKIYYMEHDGGNPFVSFVDQRIINAMHRALKHFKDEFGIESEKINISKFKFAIPFFATTCGKTEAKIEDYVSPTGKVNVYWELLKSFFGKSNISRPILVHMINQNSPYCDPKSPSYLKSIKILNELKPKIHEMLSDNAVLWMPTWPTIAPKHQTTILRGFDTSFTIIMNALELSATHCPMGLTKEEGLPLGFTVASSPRQDRISIAFAKEIERKFKGWVPTSK